MSEFKREERYIVIKRSHLDDGVESMVRQCLETYKIQTVECVVVEADWPENEIVWAMIKQRMETGVAVKSLTEIYKEGYNDGAARVALPAGVCNLLTDVAQILDVIKAEWDPVLAWSEWDQGVRDRITEYLKADAERPAVVSMSRAPQQPQPAIEEWKALFNKVALSLGCLPSAFLDDNQHVLDAAMKFAVPIAQPAAVEGWSEQTRKDIEQWMRDAIADAAQCEDVDQDIPFANAIGDLLNMLEAHPTTGVSGGAGPEEKVAAGDQWKI